MSGAVGGCRRTRKRPAQPATSRPRPLRALALSGVHPSLAWARGSKLHRPRLQFRRLPATDNYDGLFTRRFRPPPANAVLLTGGNIGRDLNLASAKNLGALHHL